MTHSEIVSRLSRLTDSRTSDVLYSITMQHVLQQIAYRMGEAAFSLSRADLLLAKEEVQVAINHSLDYREYVDEGLDVWEITRNQ